MTLLGGACFQAINPQSLAMATNVALCCSASSGVLTVMIPLYAAEPALHFYLGLRWRSPAQPSADCLKRQLFNSLMALSLVATTIWSHLRASLAA